MSWHYSHAPCHLPCIWNGTEMCVQHLLTAECIAEHHLGLAITCGLRSVYHPHGLPPCVRADGGIDWHSGEDVQAEEPAAGIA